MKRILIALTLLLPLSAMAQDRYDIPQTGTKIGNTRTGINSNFTFLFIAGTNAFRTAVAANSNINFIAKSPTNPSQIDYCLTNGAGGGSYTNTFTGGNTTGAVVGAGTATNKFLSQNGTWEQDTAGSGGSATNGIFLIAYQAITTEVTTVTFAGIPQTYKNLRIVANVIGNRANANGDNFGFRINNDSSTNYPYWYFYITGDGVLYSDEILDANFAYLGAIKGSIGETGFYSVAYCEIPEYADNTKWKSWMTFSHAPSTNAASKAYMYNTGGSWRNANAITSMVFVLSFSNLVSGSIQLWGIQ